MLALGALAFAAPARAIWLSESIGVAKLAGPFDAGDEKIFAAFLEKPRPTPLRVLWLDSRGGVLEAGVKIAALVRKARLTTAVRADAATCDSACTLVFIAGARRHYVNGQTVPEGLSAWTGLGFHGVSLRGDAARPTIKYEGGEQLLAKHYRELGVPGAADLVARAAINTVWRPSGATALRLRIATSLSEP